MSKVKQEMLPRSFAEKLLEAHIAHVNKVRRGEKEAPTLNIDYGKDGPNPYGVGASSLTKDVRQWWYGRKHYQNHDTPAEYKFTAEQGRLMEQPILLALKEMGYDFEAQEEAKNKNHGGLVDGITTIDGQKVIFESKHLGRARFLEMYTTALCDCQPGYFWQAQSYMLGVGAAYTLFIITSQDSSAVRADITRTKNWKKPALPPDLPAPNTKMFAFRLYPIEDPTPMDKRALAMMATLQGDAPPARERNPYTDWECGVNMCNYREQCLTDGPDGDKIFQLPKVEVEQIWLKQ